MFALELSPRYSTPPKPEPEPEPEPEQEQEQEQEPELLCFPPEQELLCRRRLRAAAEFQSTEPAEMPGAAGRSDRAERLRPHAAP